MQNLFIINRFEHLGLEEPVGSITSSQDRTFDVFVRVPCSKNTVSNETHIEQRAQTAYLYRRSKAYAETSSGNLRVTESKIRRACILCNEHAKNLMAMQRVTSMQWARSRARNHPIILSTLLVRRRLTVSKIYLYKHRKRPYQKAFQFCYSLEASIYHLVRNRPMKASILSSDYPTTSSHLYRAEGNHTVAHATGFAVTNPHMVAACSSLRMERSISANDVRMR